ncbi:MAG: hypothetical protein V1895_03175 [Parcubacteria group bacterium]
MRLEVSIRQYTSNDAYGVEFVKTRSLEEDKSVLRDFPPYKVIEHVTVTGPGHTSEEAEALRLVLAVDRMCENASGWSVLKQLVLECFKAGYRAHRREDMVRERGDCDVA